MDLGQKRGAGETDCTRCPPGVGQGTSGCRPSEVPDGGGCLGVGVPRLPGREPTCRERSDRRGRSPWGPCSCPPRALSTRLTHSLWGVVHVRNGEARGRSEGSSGPSPLSSPRSTARDPVGEFHRMLFLRWESGSIRYARRGTGPGCIQEDRKVGRREPPEAGDVGRSASVARSTPLRQTGGGKRCRVTTAALA